MSEDDVVRSYTFSNPRTHEIPVYTRNAYSRQQLLDLRHADRPPVAVGASRASIETMSTVIVTEEGTDCSICLESFKVSGEAKEMACTHRFHSDCIENWLRMRASCPLCRFTMPVNSDEEVNSQLHE
ncbi:PREDICTED: E3 ubiquitin-protein ligase RING1-like [Fragaria vesca subsp. vesca]|uniref:E3 ubiquitin-protein ligase RING1-like n=1 Tax=Fragaria vesca subsp. vesca TaxID=101020 RepID=UPI0002C30D09|nr:PREDICTED: E3 ubiquitin-protein ligase RING1-like [Fragaria vesca subsp. vesca]